MAETHDSPDKKWMMQAALAAASASTALVPATKDFVMVGNPAATSSSSGGPPPRRLDLVAHEPYGPISRREVKIIEEQNPSGIVSGQHVVEFRQRLVTSEAEAEVCVQLRRDLERCEQSAGTLQQQNQVLRDQYVEREARWEATAAHWTSNVGSSELRTSEQLAAMQAHHSRLQHEYTEREARWESVVEEWCAGVGIDKSRATSEFASVKHEFNAMKSSFEHQNHEMHQAGRRLHIECSEMHQHYEQEVFQVRAARDRQQQSQHEVERAVAAIACLQEEFSQAQAQGQFFLQEARIHSGQVNEVEHVASTRFQELQTAANEELSQNRVHFHTLWTARRECEQLESRLADRDKSTPEVRERVEAARAHADRMYTEFQERDKQLAAAK